jgi:beta-lactamase regulating signal transducer with metallopeptidase domain
MTLVLETVVKATFVLAAACAVNAARRRASAASRHFVWTLAVAALLVLPVLSAALPRWDVEIPVPTARHDANNTGAAGNLVTGVASSETVPTSGEAGTVVPVTAAWSWAAMAAGLYLAGLCVLVLRLGFERRSVYRLARRAAEVTDPEWTQLLLDCARCLDVRRPVRLLRSVDRSMPMAFGTRQPAIVIPSVSETWSEDRRRAVLLHELAHIARHDCLTQLLAAVACAVYWLHPGVWWVARRLRVERELACDDRVLQAGTHAREYAEHLLELAYALGGYRAPALVVSMARPRQVEGRMLAALDAARDRTAPAFRVRMAGTAIVAALLVPLAISGAALVPADAPKPRAAQAVDATPAASSPGQTSPGTWTIWPAEAGKVHLKLNERADSSSSSTIGIARLEGLTPAVLSGAGGLTQFSIRRDAGTLTFEGTFRSGIGAGTYAFAPSPTFPAEFAKRGMARPTADEQYLLARADIGYAFLDELAAQRYARPDLPGLVRSAEHGVNLDFVREMGVLGYRLGQPEALVVQRDHGVSPSFIRELAAQGLARLAPGDLIRARDHGISPQYVHELKALGYVLSLDELVAARDHGISPEYVRGMRQQGYSLTLADLTTARDHGISPEYIGELAALGYTGLPLEGLVKARDHGLSPEYVRELRTLGYRLTMEELLTARDHGVNAQWVSGLKNLNSSAHLSFDELIALRNRGTTTEGYRQTRLIYFAHAHVHAVQQWFHELVARWSSPAAKNAAGT